MSEFRTIEKNFNQDFCAELEYHLSSTFRNSADKEIRFFWCDGIQMPFDESQLTVDNIISSRKIITEAWIGADGQGKYIVTINFGSSSLKACIEGNGLKACLPNDQSMEWVSIDTKRNTIEIQLN